ncbi:hypothetical protein JHD46_05950 [Sulfurimonas sp. SAG-AH-194-C20]|nr:hypothetical protein [Sulfurimonas sp. SAG-AH-194-C20]MDF1879183.1 hypothetical protein [Sulfurimonas sp. SAG-AH-194-C20]
MPITHQNIITLLEYVKIDSFNIVCHFKCKQTNKLVISTVAFEPYDGKIEFTWQDLVLHPIKSYNRYYHTPITIYSSEVNDTIVLKAFKKVSKHFRWNANTNSYTCI